MQAHINKLHLIVDQLTNIDHPFSNEDLTFTFLGNLPPSFHTLVVPFSTYTNELSVDLVYGQLLQKEFYFK